MIIAPHTFLNRGYESMNTHYSSHQTMAVTTPAEAFALPVDVVTLSPAAQRILDQHTRMEFLSSSME